MDEQTDTSQADYPYADTPFARWLWARIAGRTLRHVARDSGVGASLLSTYLHGAALPTLATTRKLARYFGVELSEVLGLIEAAAPPTPIDIYDPALTVFGKAINGEPLTPEEEASARAWLEKVRDRQQG